MMMMMMMDKSLSGSPQSDEVFNIGVMVTFKIHEKNTGTHGGNS